MRYTYITLLFFALLSTSSCLKKGYDAPPDMSDFDPNLNVNATIADVKAIKPDPAGTSNGSRLIDTNFIIYGIVTGDDRSGNLYKKINIEDSTGGITILIEAFSLYADYPVGRKVYINLKGLYIGHYNGIPQIGFTPYNGELSNIPSNLVDNYIIKANYPNPISPIEVELSEITTYRSTLVNRVITIKDVQFQDAFLGNEYAAPAPVSGTDITLEDCNGNTVAVRTSGYAKFQSSLVATGKGDLTALYTVYRGTPQLVIRDTTDVQLNGVRCDGSSGNGDKDIITIDSLRKMYKGSTVTLQSVQVSGVVISDISHGNITKSTFVIQNGSKGIVVFGASDNSYNLGDSLVIDASGDNLEDYNGVLELKIQKGKQNNIKVAGTNKTIVPKQLTINELNASYSSGYSIHENTLVSVISATISGGATFGSNGNRTLNDGTGTLSLFTGSSSTFTNEPLPTGTKTYTGIFARFGSTKQIRIRNPQTDIK